MARPAARSRGQVVGPNDAAVARVPALTEAVTHPRSCERSDESESLRPRRSIRSNAFERAPHWTKNHSAQSLHAAAQLRPGLPGGRSRDRNLCACRRSVRHRKSDVGAVRARLSDTTVIRVRALQRLSSWQRTSRDQPPVDVIGRTATAGTPQDAPRHVRRCLSRDLRAPTTADESHRVVALTTPRRPRQPVGLVGDRTLSWTLVAPLSTPWTGANTTVYLRTPTRPDEFAHTHTYEIEALTSC